MKEQKEIFDAIAEVAHELGWKADFEDFDGDGGIATFDRNVNGILAFSVRILYDGSWTDFAQTIMEEYYAFDHYEEAMEQIKEDGRNGSLPYKEEDMLNAFEVADAEFGKLYEAVQ